MNKVSIPYKALCTEYYELDKPQATEDALRCYLQYANEAQGRILEPMCGTGRFLIPLLEQGYSITGFDYSSHMLNICRKKCQEKKLACNLVEASFETFFLPGSYELIFIPSGSFCLLTASEQTLQALKFISHHLSDSGKFVFEVETLSAISEAQGIWRANWVDRSDGSKIVLNTLSRFDPLSRIQTSLCRYELWENNQVSQIEVEDFKLRLYDPEEIELLLQNHGLEIIGKWQAEPYVKVEARSDAAVILYECKKIKGNKR